VEHITVTTKQLKSPSKTIQTRTNLTTYVYRKIHNQIKNKDKKSR